jgi:AbrB family looped-hinge helix DNA binding protein
MTMRTQSVFKAGNSNVVAIPKHLSDELGIKPGQRVVVVKVPNEEAIIIRKEVKVKEKEERGVVSKEFKRWLARVIKEDKETLDELAVR